MSLKVVYQQPTVSVNTKRKSTVATLPSPIGGWNARDALTAMKASDAFVMDNFFPNIGFVNLRKGYSSFCDLGTASVVEFLHEHIDAANRHLLAASGGAIYETSTGTASSKGTGFSSNRWHGVNFRGKSVLVNGADTPQQYDGSTLSAATYTGNGLSPANLAGVTVFKERLFFWENASQNFWYGNVKAITGTLTDYPLYAVGTKGGVIVGIETWSIDGGAGPDDVLCIFMSGGEVVLYSGSDPSDAAAWSIVGIYRIGQPVHRRAIAKFGADLAVVTRDGYVALSRVLKSAETEYPTALSDKIKDAAVDSVADYFTNFGWQIQPYPRGHYLLINVPTSTTVYHQHVMNTATGAWCRFKDQNGVCWSLLSGGLYFGATDGVVYRADDGTDDNSAEITGDVWQAWNYFGTPDLKRFTGINFQFESLATVSFSYFLNKEFLQTTSLISASNSVAGPQWDVTEWDTAQWGGDTNITHGWKSPSVIARCVSVHLRIVEDSQTPKWHATQFMISQGALL